MSIVSRAMRLSSSLEIAAGRAYSLDRLWGITKRAQDAFKRVIKKQWDGRTFYEIAAVGLHTADFVVDNYKPTPTYLRLGVRLVAGAERMYNSIPNNRVDWRWSIHPSLIGFGTGQRAFQGLQEDYNRDSDLQTMLDQELEVDPNRDNDSQGDSGQGALSITHGLGAVAGILQSGLQLAGYAKRVGDYVYEKIWPYITTFWSGGSTSRVNRVGEESVGHTEHTSTRSWAEDGRDWQQDYANSINNDLAQGRIPEVWHSDPVLQQHICPITGQPIRFVLKINNSDEPPIYFERAAIISWIESTPNQAPCEGWPQERFPLPLREEYFQADNAVQEVINNRLQMLGQGVIDV